MKKIIVNIPSFNGEFNFNWEPVSKIMCKNLDENTFIIKGNSNGLISLANHLLNLAQVEIPNNYHIHFDEYNALESGSSELIIEKDSNL